MVAEEVMDYIVQLLPQIRLHFIYCWCIEFPCKAASSHKFLTQAEMEIGKMFAFSQI